MKMYVFVGSQEPGQDSIFNNVARGHQQPLLAAEGGSDPALLAAGGPTGGAAAPLQPGAVLLVGAHGIGQRGQVQTGAEAEDI